MIAAASSLAEAALIILSALVGWYVRGAWEHLKSRSPKKESQQ